MDRTAILIDRIAGAERRRRARTNAGEPPLEWRVSMSGRVAKGLQSFEEALSVARTWTANTTWKIYFRYQSYGQPTLYDPS